MGILDWFRQLVGWKRSEEETPPQVVQEEVSSVIPIGQKGITSINDALESIASIKRAVEGGMEDTDSKLQLMARGRIASMRTGLRKMLEVKSASRDQSEMRAIAKEYTALHSEFSALAYYHQTFASDFVDLRDTLRELDTLLYPKKADRKEDVSTESVVIEPDM